MEKIRKEILLMKQGDACVNLVGVYGYHEIEMTVWIYLEVCEMSLTVRQNLEVQFNLLK